jgi:site-specific DNA recombinase
MGRKRAIIYPRVSDEKGAEKTTLETQEDAMRVHCAARGYDVIAVMPEVHTGQELWERPVLTEIREMIRRREVDVLVAYSVDRLARDGADHYGAEVEFATEEVAYTPEQMFLLQAKGFAAKIEALAIAERTMRARIARVKSGKLQGQVGACYGYRHDKASGTRLIIEHEAAVVRDIFRWTVEGLGLVRIMRRLNAKGIPPPSVGCKRLKFTPKWSIRSIQEILKNPAYKGEIHSMRYKRSKAAKRSVLRPQDEWIAMPEGACPAIVTPELWDLAQKRRQANRGDAARNEQRPFLLRGLVRCGICRRAFSPQLSRSRKVYRCCSRHTSSGACGAVTVWADQLEAWAWETFCENMERPEKIARMIERLRSLEDRSSLAADVESARRALAIIVGKQDKLVAKSLEDDPDFPQDIIKGQLARLRAEREQLESEIDQLTRLLREQQAARGEMARLTEICREVAPFLRNLDFGRRRSLMLALAVQVSVNGEHWRLRAGIPLEGEPLIEVEGVPTSSAP